MSYLDPVALAKLQTLPVKARVVVEGALSGLHRARLHGSSVEFAEHKEYSPGDEIRHIDWKAYGKLDRYYVKKYEQESQLTAYLLLDASGSMSYRGDGVSKLEYASYLVAAFAHLLIHQRDQAGLLVFGDPGRERYVPPRARTSHLPDLLAVIDEVNRNGAAGDGSPVPALDRAAELARRRRSLVVLVSDLFDRSPDTLSVLRRLRARGHDVAVFHTLDPHEITLPFSGLTLFESLEAPRKLLVDPDAVRTEYKRRLRDFLDGTRQTCVESGVDYHQVSTSQPLEQTLLDFLTRRLRSGSHDRAAEWTS